MEVWRIIPGSNYEASSLGRVRRRGHSGRLPGPALRCKRSVRGYLSIGIQIDGRRAWHNVNRLVCMAFHGPPPTPTHHAAHRDNDRSNNREDNVRWATPRENNADKVEHGTHQIGECHPRAVVTDDRAAALRAEFARHIAGRRTAKKGWLRAFADREGIAYHTVRKIVRGRGYPGAGARA